MTKIEKIRPLAFPCWVKVDAGRTFKMPDGSRHPFYNWLLAEFVGFVEGVGWQLCILTAGGTLALAHEVPGFQEIIRGTQATVREYP